MFATHVNRHALERVVAFRPQQVFNVVADVDRYHEFLPFCTTSRIVSRHSEQHWEADLDIGFRMFAVRYRSNVRLQPYTSIKIRAQENTVFKTLESTWSFSPVEHTKTRIAFRVTFEPVSSVHASAVQLFFQDVALKQLNAFQRRCDILYSHPITDQIKSRLHALGLVPEQDFTAEEIKIIKKGLGSALVTADQFYEFCCAFQSRKDVFPQFRERHVQRACASDRALSDQVFDSVAHGTDRVPIDAAVEHIYFLTRGSSMERLAHTLSLEAIHETIDKKRAEAAVRCHFKFRLRIIRNQLSDMVFKHSKSKYRGEDSILANSFEVLGIVSTVMEETEQEIENAAERVSASLADGQRPVREWVQAWEKEDEIVDLVSVVGISRLIEWAMMLKSNE